MGDKGYGFMRCNGGEAFVHIATLRGGDANIVGTRMVARVMADDSRGSGKYRAKDVWTEPDYQEQRKSHGAGRGGGEGGCNGS